MALRSKLALANLPNQGTDAQLRQRWRDYEMSVEVRTLAEQGLIDITGQTWEQVTQTVLNYYRTQLAHQDKPTRGNLIRLKLRLNGGENKERTQEKKPTKAKAKTKTKQAKPKPKKTEQKTTKK
eukprot:TRINITY_DN6449_c0_g1_i2.p1 TRINITY_DN6449_c0_g1~~TRINITY_DN6449_c0_g1_i2.p1  ORF type:complete len:124 (-),score=26.77 TRINITY_DN6449_c0_g1_i2:69-440(-)